MKKKILKILLVIVIALTAAVSVFLYRGYHCYQETVGKYPIADAVSSYTSKSDYTPYDEIDQDFVNAVVSVEDKRFSTRDGFDWIALARAIINNTINQKLLEGGSTISQQIAKNLYYQNTSRGLNEKIAEVFIMNDLENQYSKEDLFALYANMNYYGDGYYGIEAAAQGYYGVSASNLTLGQSAMLAGIPNAPGAYQLSTGYDLAVERQHKVLRLMLANDYIDEDQYNEALNEDVHPVSK